MIDWAKETIDLNVKLFALELYRYFVMRIGLFIQGGGGRVRVFKVRRHFKLRRKE